MNKDLEVISITKKMLREAVNQDDYWGLSHLPMSKAKAQWLLKNPRISDDDFCGVLAVENNKMAAFIYMFPDYLNELNQEFKKVYWMLSWWVHEDFKSSVLGSYVFHEALRITNKNIIIKSYAESATAFYEKQPFSVIAERLRYTIFFSLDASILTGRFKFLKKIKPLLDIFDNVSYWLIKTINKSTLKNKIKNLEYDYVNEIDDQLWEFIKPLCESDLIFKTKDYINWQLSKDQYLQTPASLLPYTSLQTGVSEKINNYKIKILKNNQIIGFMSFLVNRSEVNVKYFLVKNEEDYDYCVDALLHNFIKVKTKFIFTDDDKLSKKIQERFKTIYVYKINKKALIHNDLNISRKEINVFERDGHFY